MKMDDKHEIRIVIVEILPGNGLFHNYGDVYDNYETFRREKPESSFKFGYAVVDTESGLIPDGCNDWNDSIEDAMFDWEDNCL